MKPLLLILFLDIYNNDRVTKSKVYLPTLQANGVDSIFKCLDRERHRSKRKLISKVVSDRSVRLFEPRMREQIHFPPTSKPVNMTKRCKRLSLDIIGLLAFGFLLNTQTDETYRFTIKGIAFGNYRSNSFMQFPALKNRVLDTVLHALTRKGRKGYLKALERMISTRLSMVKDARIDFYSFIADKIETGRPDSIRLTELWSEAVFFLSRRG